jgi:FKBP-type peptidyl-prolyl cis-trans isomerase
LKVILTLRLDKSLVNMRSILISFSVVVICVVVLVVAQLTTPKAIAATVDDATPIAITTLAAAPDAGEAAVGEDLLAKSDYTTTASGLKYRDLVAGTGAMPQKGQTVAVQYTGTLTNGKKFDRRPARVGDSPRFGLWEPRPWWGNSSEFYPAV